MNDKIASLAENAVGKNRTQVNCSGTYAWCARFVSNILTAAGIDGINTFSCTDMFKTMKSRPMDWNEPDDYPERGDVLFFDWDRKNEEKPLDHVAIVTDFDHVSKRITYVNGNGENPNIVTKQDISVGNQSVAYWLRYIGGDCKRIVEIESQLTELKNKIEKIRNILDN